MKNLWKNTLPYDLLETGTLSFDKPVYVFNGETIQLGHFNSIHGCSLFISAYDYEETQLDFLLWCWAKDLNEHLHEICTTLENG